MEKWKDIDGYEGKYQISNYARARNIQTGNILKTVKGKTGYKVLSVYNGKHKTFKLHRLIALAFIPNPDNKPCINHKDGDKLNNSIENLEWVTHSENNKHAFDNGLKDVSKINFCNGSRCWASKITEKDVVKIKQLISKGISLGVISKKYGVTKQSIFHIKTGRNWAWV
jgi:hypothetical protein